MGAKFWTAAEDDYFWNTAMPLSCYATGENIKGSGMSWAQLAAKMQVDLDELGLSQREYKGPMLFQQWSRRFSSLAEGRGEASGVYRVTKAKHEAVAMADGGDNHGSLSTPAPKSRATPQEDSEAGEEGQDHNGEEDDDEDAEDSPQPPVSRSRKPTRVIAKGQNYNKMLSSHLQDNPIPPNLSNHNQGFSPRKYISNSRQITPQSQTGNRNMPSQNRGMGAYADYYEEQEVYYDNDGHVQISVPRESVPMVLNIRGTFIVNNSQPRRGKEVYAGSAREPEVRLVPIPRPYSSSTPKKPRGVTSASRPSGGRMRSKPVRTRSYEDGVTPRRTLPSSRSGQHNAASMDTADSQMRMDDAGETFSDEERVTSSHYGDVPTNISKKPTSLTFVTNPSNPNNNGKAVETGSGDERDEGPAARQPKRTPMKTSSMAEARSILKRVAMAEDFVTQDDENEDEDLLKVINKSMAASRSILKRKAGDVVEAEDGKDQDAESKAKATDEEIYFTSPTDREPKNQTKRQRQ